MVNEFRHRDAGESLTRNEDNATDRHYFHNQATGDILYASSATQLKRLGIGTASYPLVVGSSGVPQWGSAHLILGTADTYDIGGTSNEIRNIYIGQAGKIYFGLGQDTSISQTAAKILVADVGALSWEVDTTGAAEGAAIVSKQDAALGAGLYFVHWSTSPAANDLCGQLVFRAYNDAATRLTYGTAACRLTSVASAGDAEEARYDWNLKIAGTDTLNLGMFLTAAGGLSVDADIGTGDDPVALFDNYDDAVVLRNSIQKRNHELLCEMGVFEKKDTGSGYMMRIQPMTRLLAGGIYQNRAKIDKLEDRVCRLEDDRTNTR